MEYENKRQFTKVLGLGQGHFKVKTSKPSQKGSMSLLFFQFSAGHKSITGSYIYQNVC